ncbi:hydroxymethylbilane synthase [Candidatus Marithrix sp. Canyon 246]|uniref:hydroxymethylbilane synthase n=1 Tax=Candidatus Marithrix sp. Canyon 246 TaxID=1827136 RepID=UPI00084A24B6|nr:hydroxymethylbilane synthase [Candidatus Marithrix sp. Canyon 246]
MTTQTVRIATRKSPLALWQTNHVAQKLQQIHPHIKIELVEITTKGDKILDVPLAKIGGKGLFVKELEHCLFDKRADIAVHSVKDLPVEFPEGLILPVILTRANPYDAFVSNKYDNLAALPEGAIVGTASLRRQSQLLNHRPDLKIRSLRGNVGTRLSKLDQGEFDAIILAAVGLQRLNMDDRIRQIFTEDIMLPAIGQGAIGIECREDDSNTMELIKVLNDPLTASRVMAERALNRRLEGGCQVPIGGFAQIEADRLTLQGFVGSLDGKQVLRESIEGSIESAESLGDSLGKKLLAQGADKLLQL